MSNRLFQSVVLQMKDAAYCNVGVIDSEGTVVACTELSLIGEQWATAAAALELADGEQVTDNGRTFKALSSWSSHFDYAGFADGEDESAQIICAMAVVAFNSAKSHYEEKHDKATFVKNIITDNILMGDIYVRAKELHFPTEVPRGVLVIRRSDAAEMPVADMLQSLYPDRQQDFVLSVGEDETALIKLLNEGTDHEELHRVATQVEQGLRELGCTDVMVGIGTVSNHARDLAQSFKEAQIAIEVGKVFESEKTVINYENLGIGRLIYQLPTTLCEMFLHEVFKKNPIDALDPETLFTINQFFKNNLNVSETARKLFVHRNTLVYRLEKIKKLTGLDLREFDDAITFKVALMVKKYLLSRGIES